MAHSTALRLIPLFFALVSLCFFVSEARVLHGIQAMHQRNMNIQLFLSKIGFSVAEFEYHKRRSLNAGFDRVAPGGPDPHHHSLPTYN